MRTNEDCHQELGCAPPVLDLGIERVIAHPQYFKDELRNDIALIRLRQPVRFSQGIFIYLPSVMGFPLWCSRVATKA